MFRFESLEIWRLATQYGKELYKLSFTFPKEERFALADQLRRSALSISNNIAEGSGGTDKEFANFLNVAVKSALETVNILNFAKEQDYISEDIRIRLYDDAEILIKKLEHLRMHYLANDH